MNWIVTPPPKFTDGSLTPNMTVFGGKALKEVIKVKSFHIGETLIHYDRCTFKKRKKHQQCVCAEERLERPERGQPSAHQKESPHQKSPLLAPWFCTSSMENCEKVNLCHLSHQSVVSCYGSTNKLVQIWIKNVHFYVDLSMEGRVKRFVFHMSDDSYLLGHWKAL